MASATTREFLIEAAVLLHRYGAPSHRLERVMTELSSSQGIDAVFLYTPTALVIEFQFDGQSSTVLRRVESGGVDVDKIIRFDDLLGRVERHELSVVEARHAMAKIAVDAAPFSRPLQMFACAVSCAAVAILFGGSMADVIAAGVVGLVVAVIEWLHERFHGERGLLEPIAGLAAATSALAITHWVYRVDDRLVTLAALIVLIPGLRLTVAMTELAVGHLSAGVARLAGALVSLLTLFLGVVISWRLAGDWREFPVVHHPLPDWAPWLAVFFAPLAFAVVFRAPLAQWPVIAFVAIFGFAASRMAAAFGGTEMAALTGAFAVGCGSNLYARLRNRPALVTLTPGLLILVPGSLGYRSLAAILDRQTIEGVEFAFETTLTALSLVGGLLLSNAVVPPKRVL